MYVKDDKSTTWCIARDGVELNISYLTPYKTQKQNQPKHFR